MQVPYTIVDQAVVLRQVGYLSMLVYVAETMPGHVVPEPHAVAISSECKNSIGGEFSAMGPVTPRARMPATQPVECTEPQGAVLGFGKCVHPPVIQTLDGAPTVEYAVVEDVGSGVGRVGRAGRVPQEPQSATAIWNDAVNLAQWQARVGTHHGPLALMITTGALGGCTTGDPYAAVARLGQAGDNIERVPSDVSEAF